MKNRIHTPAQSPAELLTDLRTLVVEAEKMVENSVTEHSQEAFDAVRARFEAAQERLSGLYEGTKKKVSAGVEYADETIREKPYQSLAVAIGVGLLVGLLVGRRSK
jgi:ElaB/YqjD/DUF883 family membrane-anchored ribosome-binding protein